MAGRDSLIDAAAGIFPAPFGAVIRIEPEDGGEKFWINGVATPPTISASAPDVADTVPVCVWRASHETLRRIFEGERMLTSAYISGRLLIAGDMSIMARLEMQRPSRG